MEYFVPLIEATATAAGQVYRQKIAIDMAIRVVA